MHPWKMNLWRVKEIPKFSHSKNCGDFTFIDRNFVTRVDRFDFWDSGRHPRKKKKKMGHLCVNIVRKLQIHLK